MKTQVRRSVFETNSSSTHSISIVKESTNTHFPSVVEFNSGEFSWEWENYNDYLSKASYLYTAILETTQLKVTEDLADGKKRCKDLIDEKLNKIREVLYKYGIVCVFDSFEIRHYDYEVSVGKHHHNYYPDHKGYIDHGYELGDWVDRILNDEKLLINFLFNNDSVIETGNDNDDCPWREDFDEFEDMRNTNKYDTYIKGN